MAGSIKINFFVLDTCALIWWSLDPDKLSSSAKEACYTMEQEKNGLVPSTAVWEMGRVYLIYLLQATTRSNSPHSTTHLKKYQKSVSVSLGARFAWMN
ncbi:MAG: hypothetical protein PT116_07055 [Aphanizomenon gracile PMC638.10]|nr:hypothetical protein [Aphanizomenon gracile PMC638.10]